MSNDLDWLEGGAAETVPVNGLTKRDLSAATGYPLKKLDALCRAGLPAKAGSSKRDGLRFELPAVIEWLAEQRAAERAGPEDESLAGAKRRIALAQAHAKELENKRREGQQVEVKAVRQWIVGTFTRFRTRLESLETEIPGLSAKHQEALRDAIYNALIDLSEEAAAEALKLDKEEEAESESD